ncbi:MAG: hypothetical protein WEA76_01335 [Acidimicrobiia bacterium]
MFESPSTTIPLTRDPDLDMALAEGATVYLTRQGLDHEAIVRCLVEEFELDRATAVALADLAKPELVGQ